jgi:hypothetical protein
VDKPLAAPIASRISRSVDEHGDVVMALQETDKCLWVKLRTWVPTFLLELSSWDILRTWV